MSLTDAQLRKAIEAHEAGQPRPSGVSWSPYRVPQFLSTAEADEYDTTGVMPKSALDRYETELRTLKAFNYKGEELGAKEKAKALSGLLDGSEAPGGSDTGIASGDGAAGDGGTITVQDGDEATGRTRRR